MRLTSISVENVRRYVAPASLGELTSGLNLIVGPNGSGKSTWVRALRAALFAFHRSRQVTDLVPWAAPGSSPRVTVQFELDGQRHELTKQFFKGAFVRLQTPTESLDGEEAESLLASLLGFDFVTRGESKQLGIPGLLWIEQGSLPEMSDQVGNAGQYLRDALGNVMGQVTSTGGDEVFQQLEAQLARLRVKGRENSAKGELAEATVKSGEADENTRSLQSQLQEYRNRVDELDRLNRLCEVDRNERPWDKHAEMADKSQVALAQLEKLQDQLLQAQAEAGRLVARKQLLASENEQRRQIVAAVELRASALSGASEELQLLVANQSLVRGRLDKARHNLVLAEQQIAAARLAERDQTLAGRSADLEQNLERLDQRFTLAQNCQNNIEALTTQLTQRALKAADLDRLREIERELALHFERASAAASRLLFELEPGCKVQIGAEIISGAGERTLTEPTELNIAGVGRLLVTPGGIELEASNRARDSLEREFSALLAQLGHESSTAVAAALERQRAIEAERQLDAARLKDLAPNGVNQLSIEIAGVTGELDNVRAERSRTTDEPPATGVPGVSVSVSGAQVELETALAQHEQVLQTERLSTDSVSVGRAACQHAEQELTAAKEARNRLEALPGPDPSPGKETDSAGPLEALNEELFASQSQIAGLEKCLAAGMPDSLRLDIKRYTDSATEAREQANRRKLDQARLAAELSQAGAAGLEESYQLALAEQQRWSARLAALTLRAQALAWLVTQMQARRAQLTQRLQAPLQQRMDHYVRLLLPDIQLELDANLLPLSLSTTIGAAQSISADLIQAHGAGARQLVAAQSFGTREQLALLARLAYADLLAQAGRPTLLILDDSVLNADFDRLEQVKRMLFDAAQRHQILVFSCHPERWEGLGVAARPVPQSVQSFGDLK